MRNSIYNSMYKNAYSSININNSYNNHPGCQPSGPPYLHLVYVQQDSELKIITLEHTSLFGSGISGSLTEEMLFDESFLLMFKALLSSECLGTSTMWFKIFTYLLPINQTAAACILLH